MLFFFYLLILSHLPICPLFSYLYYLISLILFYLFLPILFYLSILSYLSYVTYLSSGSGLFPTVLHWSFALFWRFTISTYLSYLPYLPYLSIYLSNLSILSHLSILSQNPPWRFLKNNANRLSPKLETNIKRVRDKWKSLKSE